MHAVGYFRIEPKLKNLNHKFSDTNLMSLTREEIGLTLGENSQLRDTFEARGRETRRKQRAVEISPWILTPPKETTRFVIHPIAVSSQCVEIVTCTGSRKKKEKGSWRRKLGEMGVR